MKKSGKVTTFDDLHKMVFMGKYHEGPFNLVRDYCIAAGLLMERYNDGSIRWINASREQPTIEIEWYYNRGGLADEVSVPLSNEALTELKRLGLVSGTPRMGYTDTSRLVLNDRGKRTVIEEFINGGGITDLLAAGASIDMRCGDVYWR